MNSELNISKTIFGYGIVVFPLFLLIGPLFSEIFLISIIFYSIFLIIKENKYNFFLNKFVLVFLLFYLSTLFSTIYNFYNFNYAKGGIFFFRIPLFAISIWFILERYEFFNKKMVAFLLLLFLLIIFDSLLQYYSGKNLLGYEIIKGRLSSFFGDELILGSFIIRLIPIFMIYLVMNDLIGDKKINFIYLFIISFDCLVVYLSVEITSFVLLILFFFILFFMVKILRKFVILTFLAFLSLAFIASNLKTSSEIDPAKRMFNKSYSQIIGKGEERYEKHKKTF